MTFIIVKELQKTFFGILFYELHSVLKILITHPQKVAYEGEWGLIYLGPVFFLK